MGHGSHHAAPGGKLPRAGEGEARVRGAVEREKCDLARRRGDAEEEAEKRESEGDERRWIHALARATRGESGVKTSELRPDWQAEACPTMHKAEPYIIYLQFLCAPRRFCGAAWQAARRLFTGASGGVPTPRRPPGRPPGL